MEKQCNKCNITKTLDNFYKAKGCKDGFSAICKKCKTAQTSADKRRNPERTKEYYQEYRKQNPQQNRDARKRYYQKHKDTKVRNYQYQKNYGISLEDFNALFENQKGLCAICGKPETRKPRLSVDHCHTTGKVRGLLCDDCNNGIAKFNDNPETLKKAIIYLEKK